MRKINKYYLIKLLRLNICLNFFLKLTLKKYKNSIFDIFLIMDVVATKAPLILVVRLSLKFKNMPTIKYNTVESPYSDQSLEKPLLRGFNFNF